MTSPPAEPLGLDCPACGAPLPPPAPNRPFLDCRHCATAAFVDLSRVVRPLVCRPRIPPATLPGRVRAAGAGEIASLERKHVPFWEFGYRGRTLAVDAAPDEPPEVAPGQLPAGERRFWDDDAAAWGSPDPVSVAAEAAQAIASPRMRHELGDEAPALVYLPVYAVRTAAGGVLWLDALEGAVLGRDAAPDAAPRLAAAGAAYAVLAAALVGAMLLPPIPAIGLAAALAAAPAIRDLSRR